ncbi:MAG: citramalate synthase [Oscillospiraceae bacterium]|jgi:2-isopropylmalate synthase|nr:citramalate synthase [Oscillospiraceae bacterium]
MPRSIELLDSTLRDGAQAEGISFSVNDKLEIARALDALGVAYIEAGNPASNPKEPAFFAQANALRLANAKLCAFGSTRRKNTTATEDQSCAALLAANTPTVSVFGKCSPLHVSEILRTTPEENLRMIEDTCRFFAANGREVLFDAEHFFDGYKSDASYAMECLAAAARGSARVLCLCETNGGAFPWEAEAVTRVVCQAFPGVAVGIHAHNDGDMATAISCAAVQAGASHVQGTLLGFGERIGNAALCAITPNLQLKLGYSCLPADKLEQLVPTAMRIASVANVTIPKNAPFVGASAFAHKAGMHADGVMKNAGSFEHIDPAAVGNRRRFLISEVAGKAAVLRRARRLFPELPEDSPAAAQILATLKEKEFEGYSYEGADASFDLLIRHCLKGLPAFFALVSYKVLDELPYDNRGATATIKIKVGGQLKIAAAEGDGPVNALDLALREALAAFYPQLAAVQLLDYKVRIIESTVGTGTKVRVLITSGDGETQWTTVGVSHDIIEASWGALVDAVSHKLLKGATEKC